jgi:uncharacterized protein with NAD-binding domain and iron-sulfur cluster
VTAESPIKVAVVGGGCAAITAAFELTRPEHDGRYAVTVYQMGWRLGGKGASGRGAADRIEEHGLHLWMGFYENAFRLMRECYAELGRDPARCPIASWRDAFEPAPFVGVADRTPDGRWDIWKGILPPNEGMPGDPPTASRSFTIADYLVRSVAMLRTLFETIQLNLPSAPPAAASSWTLGATSGAAPLQSAILDGMMRLLQYGELATLTGMVQALGLLELAFGSLAQYPENVVVRLLEAVRSNAHNLLEERLQQDLLLRRIWQIIDLTFATLRGVMRSNLMTDPRGFDAIDEYDSREWLRLNGAAESSLGSGYLRALYDFGFSYEDGDPARPRISAGQALRSMLRAFFTYRGSFFWRMRAGMGDVVFAPLYEVLRRRGVRFEFFHRLENVKLGPVSAESPHVAALEFALQAEVADRARGYEPLVDVHGLPCWPSAPDYAQLVDGARIERDGWDLEAHWEARTAGRKVLHVGEDFDLVVLGVGIGAVPHVCRELVARDARWRAMVDHVRTVATQALQIWLRADMKQLGGSDDAIVISGFVEPFDTWADMRHLIERESFAERVQALAYFCNALPDLKRLPGESESAYAARQAEQVRGNAIRFLNEELRHLWPHAVAAGDAFPWHLLVDAGEALGRPSPATGEARIDGQFMKANVQPSDRYALSLPGSSAYRISPLDETYDNLTIAGDWTDCSFNAGCVEAAVMSGRLAAHALSQSPPLEEIVGFDHP